METTITPNITILGKHRVKIVTERFRKNATVKNNGNCCITFYNQGENTCWLLGDIKIKPGQAHEFNFESDDFIDTPFSLTFDNDGSDKDIVVTKIYKE